MNHDQTKNGQHQASPNNKFSENQNQNFITGFSRGRCVVPAGNVTIIPGMPVNQYYHHSYQYYFWLLMIIIKFY